MTTAALVLFSVVAVALGRRVLKPGRPVAAAPRATRAARPRPAQVRSMWVRVPMPGSTQRSMRARERSLPDAVELLTVAIRAGLTPSAAVRAVAQLVPDPLRGGFHGVVLRLDRGHSLQSALSALSDHVGPSAHTLVDGLANADRYGLPLAPVLDQLVTDARLARSRHSAAAARTLPVRLSFPLVMCTLPSFVLLAIVPVVLGAVSTLQGDVP